MSRSNRFRRISRSRFSRSRSRTLSSGAQTRIAIANAQRADHTEIQQLKKEVNANPCYIVNYAANVMNSPAVSQATTNSILLNGVGVGDTDLLRNRDHAYIKSIRLKYNVYSNANSLTTSLMRVVLVYDRRPNGAQIQWLDMFNTYLNNTLPNMTSRDRKRFSILHDKRYQIGMTQSALANPFHNFANSDYIIGKSLNIKYKRGLRVDYSLGTAGTIADIASGSLYLYIISDNAVNGSTGFDYQAIVELQSL